MKKWLLILLTMAGCATPGITMDAYMERAREFDTKNFGIERTPAYQHCYTGFMASLLGECHEYVDTKNYWACADKALDQMEECINGG